MSTSGGRKIRADYSGRRPNCNAARKAVACRSAAYGADLTPCLAVRKRPMRLSLPPTRSETLSEWTPRPLPADDLDRHAAAHRRGAGAAEPARPPRARSRPPPTPSSGTRTAGGWCRSRKVNRVEMSLLRGHRPRARRADGQHRALRQGPAGQQRAALGRARHGQVVAGEGVRTRRSTRQRAKPAPARSSWSRSIARTSRACPT